MGIFMYNVQFGDCFQLTENLFSPGLVIDFGSLSNLGGQFDKIIEHFKVTKPSKLLLSHYHIDHLSGLIYMMRNGNAYNFDEILIPDIFSTRGLRRAIVLLYFDDFLRSCILPRRGNGRIYTLLEFTTYLCSNPKRVTLLKRGDIFPRNDKFDTCTVLWPDENYIANYANELLQSFEINDDVIQGLIGISEITANLILSLGESDETAYEARNQEILLTIQNRLDTVFDNENLQNQLLQHQTKLIKFAHSVNVVFHNSKDGENNFLFTGDIETHDMKRIEANPDKNSSLYLHSKYEYIKIPHHGTKKHFYDYTSYSPSKILIPNGDSKKLTSYMITEDYSKRYSKISKMYCSNCNFCEGWGLGKCTCSNREIIWPDVQKYIY